LPDGSYDLGGLKVIVKDRQARLENGALAGSTALYFEEFRNILDITGLPPSTVIQATSWNQARSLGLEGVGKIECGFLADLALLDPGTCKPEAVWVDGKKR
jgi:N-acetylglucosamine-6-phosphate deacetylase